MPTRARPIPSASPTRSPRRVPLPRTWSVTALEIVVVLVANAAIILAMWVRHGGLDQASSFGGILTGIGQVTALFGTYLALIQLVLMSRSPWLDQVFGMDRLAAAHRWIGFGTVWLLLGHGIFTTIGYAIGDRTNPVAEFVTLITTYPYVLMATVSGGLFAAVAISSIRARVGRCRMRPGTASTCTPISRSRSASSISCSWARTSSTIRWRSRTGSACTSWPRAWCWCSG